MINYWDFHGKNWCKILEARIGGVERRKEKEKNSSKFLHGIKMCREPVHFSANQSIDPRWRSKTGLNVIIFQLFKNVSEFIKMYYVGG